MAEEAESVIKQLRECSAKIIKQGTVHGVWINNKEYIPVDLDTTAMDNSKTKKEGASRTYRGYDGYHPIIAYVGKGRTLVRGYMLDYELRPGSLEPKVRTLPEWDSGIYKRYNRTFVEHTNQGTLIIPHGQRKRFV